MLYVLHFYTTVQRMYDVKPSDNFLKEAELNVNNKKQIAFTQFVI